MGTGNHPDDVFKQILGEIAEHLNSGKIDNKDAHRAANEAFGRLLFSRKNPPTPSVVLTGAGGAGGGGTLKTSWMGWGPSKKALQHKVAGWDWDDYQNGFISTAHRDFQCNCGEPIAVPDYHNCKCGKIWNTYIIGTGGGKKNAAAELFIAREIPVRDDVIVAKRRKAKPTSLDNPHYDDYDKWSNDIDHEIENTNPFPSNHNPRKDIRSKGVSNGKTPPDWHKRDHSSQQWR